MSATNWVNCMPDDNVEVFTERSDERRQVFEDIASRLSITELSPLVWAFFQVCDLDEVKSFAINEKMWKLGESTLEASTKLAVLLWKQSSVRSPMAQSNKRSHSGAFSSQPPSPHPQPQAVDSPAMTRTRSRKSYGGTESSVRRDHKVADLCKERDHGLCVVSGIGAVDACHIYPWCAFGATDRDRVAKFWETLGLFWPKEKIESWKSRIFLDQEGNGYRGTETVENMLTLTATLHRFHSEGAFALRPVRMLDDNTQLELEFHWLARQKREPSMKVDLLVEPQSSRDRKDSGKGYWFCRFADSSKSLLTSGTRFTMTTDDPVNKPLPDPGLLELQWHLQRVLAISGAAGWKEEDFDDNNPGTCVPAGLAVTQWVEDLPAGFQSSGCSSPGDSVDFVFGAFE